MFPRETNASRCFGSRSKTYLCGFQYYLLMFLLSLRMFIFLSHTLSFQHILPWEIDLTKPFDAHYSFLSGLS